MSPVRVPDPPAAIGEISLETVPQCRPVGVEPLTLRDLIYSQASVPALCWVALECSHREPLSSAACTVVRGALDWDRTSDLPVTNRLLCL